MTSTVLGLSFDAADPAAQASFWAAVLGREVSEGASGQFAAVAGADVATSGPFLMFHAVPEGKSVKNRLHLDLAANDFPAESARLISLGANRVRDAEEDGRVKWTTFADPEGNEFDLVNR
jgi:predicted enzyme related to lactoylglutathione lyase